jgi:hemerythrin-like metal-binding protein
VWPDALEVGHEVLDGRRRKLFDLGNEIIWAISSKRPRKKFEMLLYNVVREMEIHFRSEEEITAGENNSLQIDHTESHHTLLDRTKLLPTRYSASQLQAGEWVGFIAYDFVAQRIDSEKMKFCYQPDGYSGFGRK